MVPASLLKNSPHYTLHSSLPTTLIRGLRTWLQIRAVTGDNATSTSQVKDIQPELRKAMKKHSSTTVRAKNKIY